MTTNFEYTLARLGQNKVTIEKTQKQQTCFMCSFYYQRKPLF